MISTISWPSRSKSMPAPGVSSIAVSMSAKVFCPSARRPAMTSPRVVPAGICEEIAPEKMTSMARPVSNGA